MFGVARSQVSRIKNELQWLHLWPQATEAAE
jgi:hypothetical protein